MDTQIITLLVEKNSADIEAIVSKIGITTLLQLLPHIANIAQTLSAQKTY